VDRRALLPGWTYQQTEEVAMRKPTRTAVDDYRHPFRTGKQRRAAS
jgi:hypothetical protein